MSALEHTAGSKKSSVCSFITYMILGMLFNFVDPQSLHLENEDNKSTYPYGNPCKILSTEPSTQY